MADTNIAVLMKGITKVYPNGIAANQGVDFNVRRGEIHALMGENGAGKSTLMKMLFGLEQPTEGEIVINGETVSLTSPTVAISKGIGMVHQHFMLVPSLTVAENIVLGMEPTRGMFIDYAELMAEDEQLMSMKDWLAETDRFLTNNRRKVLEGKGRISHDDAVKKVSDIYTEFRKKQDADYISEFDRQTAKYLKGETDD